MNKLLLIFFVFVITTNALGQLKVSGRVVDEHLMPVQGVNIIVIGRILGTITDVQGNFSLTIQADSARLMFSAIGFKNQFIRVAAGDSLGVKLYKDRSEPAVWEIKPSRLLFKKKDKTGTTYVYANDTVLLSQNTIRSKIVAWQHGKYMVYLPLDSLVYELKQAIFRPDDIIEFGLSYLKQQESRDTVTLSTEFVEKVGEVSLGDLAIKMIKASSIVISGKGGTSIRFLIAKNIFWVGDKKKCRNCCWGGIQFLVGDEKEPLFEITRVIC